MLTRCLLVLFSLLPALVEASVIFAPNHTAITVGDVQSSQNGTLTANQTYTDLINAGYSYIGTGCARAPALSTYCSLRVEDFTGPTGTTVRGLKFRYLEGPTTDSCCLSHEDRLDHDLNHTEIWDTYWIRFEPIPSTETAAVCYPNCPTTSSFHDTATKLHYYHTNDGVSFVGDHFWGDRRMSIAVQNATDTGTTTLAPNVASVSKIDNQWYCEEVHLKLNDIGSANGVAEAFSNGTQTISSTGRTFRSSSSTVFIDWENYRQNSGWQVRKEWGHQLSTTRVGCGSGPPPADFTPPVKPTNLTATASSTGTISLAWTATTDSGGSGLGGYNILRCTGSCTPTVILQSVGSGATSFIDSNAIAASTTYTYAINAFDNASPANVSLTSATASATTAAAIQQITTASDDFVRADAASLGTNWTGGFVDSGVTQANFAIVSNKAVSASGALNAVMIYNTAPPNDQWGQVTYSVITNGVSAPGILLRTTNSPDHTGYGCRTTAATPSRIEKRTLGVLNTSVTTGVSWTWQAGDISRCEVTGSGTATILHYAIRAGVQTLLNTMSDSSSPFTSGKAGLVTFDATPSQTQLSSFSFGGWGAPVAPLVTGYSGVTRTQATITYSGSPAYIHVIVENDDLVEPISAFVNGLYTYASRIVNGLTDFIGFAAQDAGHVEQADPVYAAVTAAPADTTAPVFTPSFPLITLPSGSTQINIQGTTDEAATVAYSTTDQAYSLMPFALTPSPDGKTHSKLLTGLTDGSDTTYYFRPQDKATPTPNAATSSQTIRVIVAAAPGSDVTAPTPPSNLAALALSTGSIKLDWTVSTDANAPITYHVFFSLDGTNYSVATQVTTNTATIPGLAPSTLYYWKINAFDPPLNASAYSNVATATTLAVVNATPPVDMSGLALVAAYQRSLQLTWTPATDTRGPLVATIEQCTGAACSSFVATTSGVSSGFLMVNLLPSTTYCFRGQYSVNNVKSVNYSSTLCAATLGSGPDGPRAPSTTTTTATPRNLRVQ